MFEGDALVPVPGGVMPDGEGGRGWLKTVRRKPVDELVVVKWRNLMTKKKGFSTRRHEICEQKRDFRTSAGSMKLCVADQACGVMRLYKGNCCCGL